jgi:hypothetical protein
VIDAMGERAVNEVRNWFCNFILEPYRKLFTPGMGRFAYMKFRLTRGELRQH